MSNVREALLKLSSENQRLKEDNEKLKRDLDYARSRNKKDIDNILFIQKAIGCDLGLRNAFMSAYESSTVDMSRPWKANAAIDVFLYVEDIRIDPSTFKSLYGMSWMDVLRIIPVETIDVLNAYAHSQVENNAIGNPMFKKAAREFFRVYSESDSFERLHYTSQSRSPLRLAYNNFWTEYHGLEWKGILRAGQEGL